jgi:hypothetical protein
MKPKSPSRQQQGHLLYPEGNAEKIILGQCFSRVCFVVGKSDFLFRSFKEVLPDAFGIGQVSVFVREPAEAVVEVITWIKGKKSLRRSVLEKFFRGVWHGELLLSKNAGLLKRCLPY